MKPMAAYLSLLPCLVLLDGLWLFFSIDTFYKPIVGHLLAENPNWLAAALFYALYAYGVFYFVVKAHYSTFTILKRGALFGLVCYGTFELTSWAIMKGWDYQIVFIDMAWGAILTSISALIAFKVAKKSDRLFF